MTGQPNPAPRTRPVRADYTGHSQHHEVRTPEQIREVGRRRRDAEGKLQQHLLEARSKPAALVVPDSGDAEE